MLLRRGLTGEFRHVSRLTKQGGKEWVDGGDLRHKGLGGREKLKKDERKGRQKRPKRRGEQVPGRIPAMIRLRGQESIQTVGRGEGK